VLQYSVIFTAFLLGAAGGPHCVAMCGCLFNGVSQPILKSPSHTLLSASQAALHAGRLTSYAFAGAVASLSIGIIRSAAQYSASLKPLWTMALLAAVMLGLSIAVYGRQPQWMESASRRISISVNKAMPRVSSGNLKQRYVAGLAWALLPCGLLYSALLVAALSNDMLSGATAMLAFGIGSGLSLQLWSWLWQRSTSVNSSPRDWQASVGTRLAGVALIAFSLWALFHGMQQGVPGWCVIPF
jgi:uncharacterized protein